MNLRLLLAALALSLVLVQYLTGQHKTELPLPLGVERNIGQYKTDAPFVTRSLTTIAGINNDIDSDSE